MTTLKYKIIIFFALLQSIVSIAQPTPAAKQSTPILINGGVIHVGNGEVLQNSLIAISNGKIELVAGQQVGRGFPGYKVIDATGKHIYPAFIAPNSQLGLTEIEAVRATNDHSETGGLNPDARAIVAYNTDSEVPPTVRSNGVLIAQIVPNGGLVSGQSSVVQLDAWNWEDAVYRMDDGLHLNWPSPYTTSGWWAEPGETSKNEGYNKQIKDIEQLFNEAKAYANTSNILVKNLRLDAMKGLFNGSKTLYIHANSAKEIQESVQFALKNGLKMVLVEAQDSWMLCDLLKKNNIPVILNRVHTLPTRNDEDIDQTYKTAAQLQEAGVLFCFSTNSGWQQRNLPFQAGHAVGFGVPYEAAISALTMNTAKILGIGDKTGTLEVGKDANLFICDGDALDMRTNKVTLALIQGREIDLDNKQKFNYRRFQERYKQQSGK
jgi:imidazolonepropionase-like amidohydrolase